MFIMNVLREKISNDSLAMQKVVFVEFLFINHSLLLKREHEYEEKIDLSPILPLCNGIGVVFGNKCTRMAVHMYRTCKTVDVAFFWT